MSIHQSIGQSVHPFVTDPPIGLFVYPSISPSSHVSPFKVAMLPVFHLH
jgi:hypothetical protein